MSSTNQDPPSRNASAHYRNRLRAAFLRSERPFDANNERLDELHVRVEECKEECKLHNRAEERKFEGYKRMRKHQLADILNQHYREKCDNGSFRFFSLPAELRLQIYENLLNVHLPPGEIKHYCFPEILRTCRQVHNEAHLMLYANNPLRVCINIVPSLRRDDTRPGRVDISIGQSRLSLDNMTSPDMLSWPPCVRYARKVEAELSNDCLDARTARSRGAQEHIAALLKRVLWSLCSELLMAEKVQACQLLAPAIYDSRIRMITADRLLVLEPLLRLSDHEKQMVEVVVLEDDATRDEEFDAAYGGGT